MLSFTSRAVVFAAALLFVLAIPAVTEGIEVETFGFEPWPATVAGERRGGFDLRAPPGGETSFQARIYNTTDQDRTYRLYGADVTTDPDTGDRATTGADATPRGVGGWVRLEPEDRDLELGPRESRVIEFRIVRPSAASVGGLGAIVAEELAPAKPGGGISVRFRIALSLDARANSANEGLVVEALDLDVPLQFLPSRGTLRAVIRNGDPDTISGKVQLHVDRGGGRFILVQEQITLRPGDRAEYEAPWTSLPVFGGSATPGVELAWDGGNLILDGDRVFVVPLWLPVLVLLLAGTWALRAWARRIEEDEPAPQDASVDGYPR